MKFLPRSLLSVLFILASGGLYLYWGSPDVLVEYYKPESVADRKKKQELRPALAEYQRRVFKQEQLVRRHPEQALAWQELAALYRVANKQQKALSALEKSYALQPDNVALGLEVIKLTAELNNGMLPKSARSLAQQLLERSPSIPLLTGILALDSYHAGDFSQAIAYWQQLKTGTQGNQDLQQAGQAIDKLIAMAREYQQGTTIQLAVDCPDSIRRRFAETDQIFITVKPINGRMPVVAVKRKVGDLPLQLVLSNRDAMDPANKLENHPQMQIEARISLSGTAERQKGDFYGKSTPISLQKIPKLVTITIDQSGFG